MCLPAYILIYLRALNWTSNSFGPFWSHSRVKLHHCTPVHAGMRRYRDPVHTSICLMSAAAGRVLHSRSIDKHAIPPTRGQINTRGTPFQANELLMLIWNSNIFWRGAPWSSSTCGRMWMDSGSCAPSSTVLVSGWIEWGHIICMSMGSGRLSSLLMANL